MPETEIHVELVSEIDGDVDRVAMAHPLVAVVITKSGPAQLMPLVRLVAELRGQELSEVAPRIAGSSGVILRDATSREAEALSVELNRQDVPFALIPTRELPEFEEIASLFRVRVATGGMRLRREDGRHVDVRWKEVLTISCVRLEGRVSDRGPAPSRLVLTIVTREPFTAYQLTQNVPTGAFQETGGPYEPKDRFERLGRAIYETFSRSAQNKGMRILSSYGLKGRWKGLTFESIEEVHAYNYWIALLRKYQADLRGAARPKFSIPWLRRVEFEPEARPHSATMRYYRVPHKPVPEPVRGRPPIVISPGDWIPDAPWPSTKDIGGGGTWLAVATIIAAICLAAYIILEFLG